MCRTFRQAAPRFFFTAFLFPLTSCLFFSGCGPRYTYPADRVPKSVEELCRKELNTTVSARVVGKTLGALAYIDDLVDDKGQMSKQVQDLMGKVMQAATRVALSTDLPIDFCVVVLRDGSHSNELLITRSTDDTKKASSDAIGMEEAFSRTLFGQQKFVKDLDGKKTFVLREVKLETFLADQIVQRLRYNVGKGSKESADDAQSRPLLLVDGSYDTSHGLRSYRFSMLSLKSNDPRKALLSVFKIVNDVLAGYHFKDFDELQILDYLNRQKLVLKKEALLDYQNKKIKEEEILKKYLTESESIQEAFKLFGFNSQVNVSADADALPIAVAP